MEVNYEISVPRKFDCASRPPAAVSRWHVQGGVNVRTEGGGLGFDGVEATWTVRRRWRPFAPRGARVSFRLRRRWRYYRRGIRRSVRQGQPKRSSPPTLPRHRNRIAAPHERRQSESPLPATAMVTLDAHTKAAGSNRVAGQVEGRPMETRCAGRQWRGTITEAGNRGRQHPRVEAIGWRRAGRPASSTLL